MKQPIWVKLLTERNVLFFFNLIRDFVIKPINCQNLSGWCTGCLKWNLLPLQFYFVFFPLSQTKLWPDFTIWVTRWVWILLRRDVLDTTLYDKVCQWLATGRWFSPGTLISSTQKTDRHDIAGMLLHTITLTLPYRKL